jgi:hypothetical protein
MQHGVPGRVASQLCEDVTHADDVAGRHDLGWNEDRELFDQNRSVPVQSAVGCYG